MRCSTDPSIPTIEEGTEEEKSVMRMILLGRRPQDGLDDNCARRLRHFLTEFAAGYVSSRTKDEVSPRTMHTYVMGVQRRLRELGFDVNLFDGAVFNERNMGLKTVLDNRFAEQQSRGKVGTPHNVLTISDIKTIFMSEFCKRIQKPPCVCSRPWTRYSHW